ncbi:MAG: amidophosphoribosyltransferase [Planctomycetota bacterium]|nr:MAG: amidophosphoribosyltransferase [Planctomycetota bacterium]
MVEGPREACGLFGVFGRPQAARWTHRALFALQHRGQESAGIAVVGEDGVLRRHRGMGTVGAVFDRPGVLERLEGSVAVGHVRYSTTGSSLLPNAQPLLANTQWGAYAIAHNGNLVNGSALRAEHERGGSIFQTTSDSEVVLHLLAAPGGAADPLQRIAAACRRLRGAYSLLVATPRRLFAVRDPQGFRPLWLGRDDEGAVAFASETPAFDIAGVRAVREVEPGTIVEVSDDGLREHCFAEPAPARCAFEHVYFARPDGFLFGDPVGRVRKELGAALAREHPAEADVVVSIPDSGNEAALGFSQASGIPIEHGFIRNHYVGRTFIEPEQADRARFADLKLNVVRWVVEGRRVVVVDDSVVRGTTARRRCRFLREAGAREVHLRVSCPPIRNPCFYGVDFQSKGELLAAVHDLDAMARELEVDSLGFLSLEGLLGAMGGAPDSYCTACWSGRYPVPVPEGVDKKSCGEASSPALEG